MTTDLSIHCKLSHGVITSLPKHEVYALKEEEFQ